MGEALKISAPLMWRIRRLMDRHVQEKTKELIMMEAMRPAAAMQEKQQAAPAQ